MQTAVTEDCCFLAMIGENWREVIEARLEKMIDSLGPPLNVHPYYGNGPASLSATLSLCDLGLLSLSEAEQRVAEILLVDCWLCNLYKSGASHRFYVQVTKDCDHLTLFQEAEAHLRHSD